MRTTNSEDAPTILAIIRACWKWAILFIVLLVLLSLVTSYIYTVQQNEVAAVTRGGSLISSKPEGPGYHFKMPWIDEVHKIRMSIDKLPIDKLVVKTTDNQFVTVDLSLTYRVADPFKALFQVGEMGSGSIIDKVVPFVQSRALDVFGQVNALQIVDQKKKLESDILLAVQVPAVDFFGERVEDVQITHIEYSEGFEKNIEKMVQTRNEQISAQNMLVVRQTEAQQTVAIAKGNADAAAAQADGAKRVAIANAEGDASSKRLEADAQAYTQTVVSQANAKSISLVGQANADAYAAKIKAAGSADSYAGILRAEAANKWTGSVPVYQFGGEKGGTEPVLILPSKGS